MMTSIKMMVGVPNGYALTTLDPKVCVRIYGDKQLVEDIVQCIKDYADNHGNLDVR